MEYNLLNFHDEPRRKSDLTDRVGEAFLVSIVIILIGLTVWLSFF